MNSQDQMEIYQELQQKGYLNYASLANASDSGVYGKMYQLIGQYDKTSGQFGLANTAAARAEYLRAAEYRNTDWFDTLFSHLLRVSFCDAGSWLDKTELRLSLHRQPQHDVQVQ